MPTGTNRDVALSLDVAQLRRAGALVPGRVGDWQWTHEGEPFARITLAALKRRLVLHYRFCMGGSWQDIWQTVPVIRPQRFGCRRLYFLCPGGRNGKPCKNRVERLVSAGAYFLCGDCARRVRAAIAPLRSRPRRIRLSWGCSAIAAGASALIASANALAAGFMVRENSGIGVGMVFAGNGSRADSPATAFNNPAGMTYLREKGVEFGTAAILPVMKFNGSATAFGQAVPSSGGSKDMTSVIPNLYWVFGDSRLSGGIAITAPFGEGSAYDDNWAGRYLGITTQAFTIDVNPNVAYRLSDSVSIGGGISAQYMKFNMSSALPQFAIFGPGTPDALYRLKADDWAMGFNLGVLWEPTTTTRIGLTYRSKIDHSLKGNLDFTGALPVLGLTSSAASAGVRLPATAGVSITHDIAPNLSLSADVQFTDWSVLKQAIIRSANPPFPLLLGYRDSWLVTVGGSYNLDTALTLRAGFGWDQTPVTDAFRAVNLADEDRLLAGVGFTYRLTQALAFDAGYQHSFPARHADMNRSINNTDPLTHAVTLNGRYNVNVNVVAASLRYTY